MRGGKSMAMTETATEQAAREAMNAALLQRIPALLTTAYGQTARRDWAGLMDALDDLRHIVQTCQEQVWAARAEELGR